MKTIKYHSQTVILPIICAILTGCYATRNLSEQKTLKTFSEKSYECRFIGKNTIIVDGRMSEPCWGKAAPMHNFMTAGPNPVSAKYHTTVKMLWDNHFLYAAFHCSNDQIISSGQHRDDEIWNGESAELLICPQGADNPYFEIDVNPSNIVYDSYIHSWKWEDLFVNWKKWALAYNASAITAVSIFFSDDKKPIGWCAEIAIPFSSINRKPHENEQWLFNAARAAVKDDKTIEFSSWGPTGGDFHRPFTFPRLVFLKR